MGEALTAMAVEKTGMPDYNAQFEVAWERILFNQFHDILPGSNTPDSRDHAMGAFEEALGCVMAASGAALRAFADAIDTSAFETPFEKLTSRSEGGGQGLNVDQRHRFRLPGTERGVGKTRLLHFFNPTGFDRDEVLEATIWDWPGDAGRVAAYDVQGNPLPVAATTVNRLDWSHLRTDLLIRAKVPALSYTTIRIEESEKQSFCFSALPPDPRVHVFRPLVLENDLVKVEFDYTTLAIKSYVNKKTGKEVLGPAGGRFVVYREGTVPRGGCGWMEGLLMDPKDLHQTAKVLLKSPVRGNALRKSLEYELHYNDSVVTVTPQLDADSPVLELNVTARWREVADREGTPRLSFRADLPYTPEYWLSDSQIGMEKRTADETRDYCGRNFFYADGGMTLLSDTKYGYRGHDHQMEVTLLRSSSRPDPFPEVGDRAFRIGLAEASGDAAELKELGWRFAHRDLPYASNRAHKGTLPLEGNFLQVVGAIVTAVKVAEDKNGTIVRLIAVQSEGCLAEVSMPGLKAAQFVDLAEQTVADCDVVDGKIIVPMGHDQTVALRLITK